MSHTSLNKRAVGTPRGGCAARSIESLEQRCLLDGVPVISEFMAVNRSTRQDEDGDFADWIEVSNAGNLSIDLDGYSLTDDPNDLNKWRFPDRPLTPGQHLVVYASSKNRAPDTGPLHTNFKLAGDGEFLALVAPDGVTTLHQFAPQYPPQVADVSYGVSPDIVNIPLVSPGVTARFLTPVDDSLDGQWQQPEFDDTSWREGATPLGYETGGVEEPRLVEFITALDPLGYWRFEETEGRSTFNRGRLTEALVGTYIGNPNQAVAGPGASDTLFGFDDDNGAIFFDGNDDGMSTAHSPLNDLGQFTMMGLIQPASFGVMDLWGQHDAVEFGFSSDTTLQVRTVNGGSLEVDYPFRRSEWHHVAVVGTGTELEIYLDGKLAGSGGTPTGNYGSSDFPFNIGHGVLGSSGDSFRGYLDEVVIFDRSLTARQITQLFDDSAIPTLFEDAIATDIQQQLASNSTAFVRVPFETTDPSRFNHLVLSLRYDDGFVAYVNGAEVLRQNAPGKVDTPLSYDAAATVIRPDNLALRFASFDISSAIDTLLLGTNILAIQGLNRTADNPDFLLEPQLNAGVITVDLDAVGYLTPPTPASPNAVTSAQLGPIVTAAQHRPQQPTAADPIVVNASVSPTLQPVLHVELVYRVMYGDTVTMRMVDDGTSGDSVAKDGIYTAIIPAGIAQPGEMVRWYIRASDTAGAAGRLPGFAFDMGQNQSPEYLGTMIADPSLSSQIAVLHWFVEDEVAAGGRDGTRASLFYLGEFYDNLFVRQRGGSTANNTVGKTNFKFDFKGKQFRFDPAHGRVEEFNLNSTVTDKAYVRQALAFDAYTAVGTPSSLSFPMHVRRNNKFYGVFNFIEEPDAELLERVGLDSNGALYKMYNEFTNANGNGKKTRKNEDNSDLADFIASVSTLRGEKRTAYLFDNVDIPAVLNYLVATVLVHQNDNPHKNHFLYRDTEGSGEWLFLPWDNDLTWGSNWVGDSFSDVIYADVDNITFGPKPNHNPLVIHPSHPLVNTERYREWGGSWNRLMDAVLNEPVILEMYLRRLRTAMDTLLGPPGTSDSYFDQRWDESVDELTFDVQLDYERWADPWVWGEDQSFMQAVDVIKNEYIEVRRKHLYHTHNVDRLTQEETIILIPSFTTARYFVPGDNSLGVEWTTTSFDDSSWDIGETGFGYEKRPRSLDEFIRTRVKPSETFPDSTSIFVRMPFQVDDLANFEQLTLRMKYDDGFVAYLNGVEVARSNLRDDVEGAPSYDTRAITRAGTPNTVFEDFDITEHIGVLQQGTNVLAIHSLNSSATNLDQLVLPELIEGAPSSGVAGIPHGQRQNPAIIFDETDFDVNPVSGNQDEEYLKLFNNNEVAVDVSGWHVTGGIEHTFRPGTVIPANRSLYISPNVRAFRNRTSGPTGGQSLFVQGNYSGQVSSFGETIQLVSTDGTLIDSFQSPSVPSDVQRYLRITEVNYNPPGNADDAEFIELQNISSGDSAVTLDLGGVTLVDGPSEPFTIADGILLASGQYLVIVKDELAFQATYPDVASTQIVGPFTGSLSNDGERIKLNDASNSTIVELTYDDNGLWPVRADGAGGTLVLTDPVATPRDELEKPYRWRGSTQVGGSPGADARDALGVVVNEVLATPDRENGQSDSIELLNTGQQTVAIGGWWLSDTADELQKYAIPPNTQLAPGNYIVFNEADFNPSLPSGELGGFGLDGAQGDDVWLTVPDAAGQTALFADDVHFGAATQGESFGRYPDGSGLPVPMTLLTFGHLNALPRVGPVVLSEIQYHPGQPSGAELAANKDIESNDLEFIEIYNPTGQQVNLTEWRVRGGVDFTFESDIHLEAGQTVIILPFDPANAANASRLDAFRSHYGIDSSVRTAGGYRGQLSNSTDHVQLETSSGLLADEVVYDDLAPWPAAADGNGYSLHRRTADIFGNAAGSWTTLVPTPGRTTFSGEMPADLDADGLLTARDIDLLFQETQTTSPDMRFDLDNDNRVDRRDVDLLVRNILKTDYGDTDLDGDVDQVDFMRLARNFGRTDAGWSLGDFDGDGVTDFGDFVILANRFGKNTSS